MPLIRNIPYTDVPVAYSHNLGFYPNIQARSAGGLAINGRLQHVSVNQATITFLTALTGTARAN